MSPRDGRRYVLDRWVRRRDGGRLLAGGAPGRLVRLGPAGARALDQLLEGTAPVGAAPLRDRLRGHGMLHPVAETSAGDEASTAAARGREPAVTEGASDVAGRHQLAATFVIPSRDGGRPLAELAGRLRGWGPVIVVDDGSRDGSAQLAEAAGATVVANAGRPGPAGARNTGLAAAETELVAFLDADCLCPAEWARPLAALLAEEPELAIAAPRVRSAAGDGAIARYERIRSPLDMGADPSRCGPGRRVAYVPSAALVARRAALLAVGGFDEELRFGEDVDLCLRLHAAGWAVRYAPEVEVEHLPRATAAGLARQRFGYGGSAARLNRRHPGLVAPLRVNRHAAAIVAAGVLGAVVGARAGATRSARTAGASDTVGASQSIRAGATDTLGARRPVRAGAATAALAVAGSAAFAASKGWSGPTRAALAITAIRGHAVFATDLARALARDWLPLTLAAVVASKRARQVAAVAVAVDALSSRGGERPPLPAGPALRLLDNAAYAAGLWRGMAAERSLRAALPALHRPVPASARPLPSSAKQGGR